MGLIVRSRRDAIDQFMKGQIDAPASKLADNLSKKTVRRLILMETCLSCGLVNTICEYITALDSSRFGYRNGSGSAAEVVHSYSDLSAELAGPHHANMATATSANGRTDSTTAPRAFFHAHYL